MKHVMITAGQESGLFILCDDEHFDFLNQFRWVSSNNGAILTRIKTEEGNDFVMNIREALHFKAMGKPYKRFTWYSTKGKYDMRLASLETDGTKARRIVRGVHVVWNGKSWEVLNCKNVVSTHLSEYDAEFNANMVRKAKYPVIKVKSPVAKRTNGKEKVKAPEQMTLPAMEPVQNYVILTRANDSGTLPIQVDQKFNAGDKVLFLDKQPELSKRTFIGKVLWAGSNIPNVAIEKDIVIIDKVVE